MAGIGRKLYRIKLTNEERQTLEGLVRRGNAAGWKIKRAQCLLKCDESPGAPAWTDAQIAEAFDASLRSLTGWRKRAAERGPLSLLERKKQDRSASRKLDGAGEAELVRLACSTPPAGHRRWSLRLLASELVVGLEDVDSVSHELVRRTLSKTT